MSGDGAVVRALPLRSSARLRFILISLHGALAYAYVASGANLAMTLCGLAVVTISLVFSIRQSLEAARHILLLGSSLSLRRTGDEHDYSALEAHCLGWAVWIRYRKQDGSTARLMVIADNLPDRSQWRLLKAWARHRVLSGT